MHLNLDNLAAVNMKLSAAPPGYENESLHLNLGAETPALRPSVPPTPSLASSHRLKSMWSREGLASYTSVPARPKTWRSTSFQDTKADRAAKLDKLTSHSKLPNRDCGICFETATNPCKTSCCSSVFCTDHLNTWLQESPDSACPQCNTRCVVVGQDTTIVGAPASIVPQPSSVPSSSSSTAEALTVAHAPASKARETLSPIDALIAIGGIYLLWMLVTSPSRG